MAGEAKKLTGSDNLCLAGGVALSCVANGELLKSKLFKNIFIQPAAAMLAARWEQLRLPIIFILIAIEKQAPARMNARRLPRSGIFG